MLLEDHRAFLRVVAALAVLGSGAAHARPGPSPARDPRDRSETPVGPGHWFPVAGSAEPRVADDDPDGTVRVIDRGLRLVEYPDGRVERARDLLPEGTAVGVLELPGRLGGGFVFRATAQDGGTRLYRTSRWTEDLVPLVTLSFETTDLVAGFDCLYAVSSRTRAAAALDPVTGQLRSGASGLPAAAGYGGMAFRDGWLGAVEADVRGLLVTFDAGESYHPLGMRTPLPGVSSQNGRIIVNTTKGAYELQPSGALEQAEGPSTDSLFGDLGAAVRALSIDETELPEDRPDGPRRAGSLEGRPLEIATLRGYPDSAETAVVLHGGTLAQVDLRDGRIRKLRQHAVPDGDECQAVRLGSGLGFVCGEDRGRTTLHALSPDFTLTPVLAFTEPRRVLPNGRGAFAIHGSCPGGPAAEPGRYCVVSAAGKTSERRIVGDPGAERVVASSDGGLLVLVPPRGASPGAVTWVLADGRQTPPKELSLHEMSAEARDLVQHGFFLDGWTEVEHGVFSGWVVGASSFAGVRVTREGTVRAGPVQKGPERALLSAAYALLPGAQDSGFESTDGGATWSAIPFPSGRAEVGALRGCTPVGCSTGAWFRVGWGGGLLDLRPAADPPPAKLEPAPIVTWALECAPTGETDGAESVRAVRAAGHSPGAARGGASGGTSRSFAELETSAFRPFLGVPSPALGDSDLGFDFGTEDQIIQLRGYVWGARGAAWDRAATWIVRGVDRFAVRNAIWSTASSRPPWPDAGAAAEVFGSDPSHRIANEWGALFDPGGDGGVVVMRTGSRTDLAVLERNKAIVLVRNSDEFVLERPTSAVEVQGKWYLGVAPGPRAFQVLGIEGGALGLVASFPRHVDDSTARLVRSTRGDALGIWVTGRGQQGTAGGGNTWFVYPIDPRSGEALPPLIFPRRMLASAPPPCAGERDGWVLVHEVSPSVAKVDIPSLTDPPAMQHLEARLVAGAHGLCVDAFAAQVDGEPPRELTAKSAKPTSRPTASLALTDRATDRRFGFRCAP